MEGGDALPCFSSYAANQRPFHGLHSAMSATFLSFFLVILLLKMAPNYSAEVPPSIPKCKNTMVPLTETIPGLDELCSGMSVLLTVSLVLIN